nr:hypothetical protein [Tanacetum cinerariifolium]
QQRLAQRGAADPQPPAEPQAERQQPAGRRGDAPEQQHREHAAVRGGGAAEGGAGGGQARERGAQAEDQG